MSAFNVAPTSVHSASGPPERAQVTPVESDAAGGGRLHLAYIDGLRALAALYVVCVHLLPRGWGEHTPRARLLRLLAKVTSQGHFAVTAFIVLSGFCLMLPVARGDMRLKGGTRVFFLRRFWRIAPPMYAAVALAVLILQVPAVRVVFHHPQVTLRQLLAHLTLTQTFVPAGLLPNDGPLWSISVECLMYLFFPPMLWLARRAGMAKTAAIYVFVGYAIAMAFRGTWLVEGTWQYLGAFAIGASAAVLAYGPAAVVGERSAAISRRRCYLTAAACLATAAGPVLALGWGRAERWVVWLDLPVAIASAAILVGASRPGRNFPRRVLEFRPLAAVGLFSYSLYMIHYPLADLLVSLIPRSFGEVARETILAGVVAPIILLGAYVFYRAFERPFHQISRRIGRGGTGEPRGN